MVRCVSDGLLARDWEALVERTSGAAPDVPVPRTIISLTFARGMIASPSVMCAGGDGEQS